MRITSSLRIDDSLQPVLEQGFIRLDAKTASDLSVINAARVSFGRHHRRIEDGDEQLINFLLREKHGTPFEHNFFRFHVKAPIFVAREWFRHRIGWSYNEYSGRYSEMPTDAYLPKIEQMRTQVGKPGAYTFEPLENAQLPQDDMATAYNAAFRTYKLLLDRGVAKEVARMVLPLATYTEFYATTNARALMNFINLRADSNAQWEIQQYAKTLSYFLRRSMPLTWKAFQENNQQAP